MFVSIFNPIGDRFLPQYPIALDSLQATWFGGDEMTQGSSSRQLVLATVGVAMALLLAALDQTGVGVAMPRIVQALHGLSYYAWVTTAYLITSTPLVPVAAALGDILGPTP